MMELVLVSEILVYLKHLIQLPTQYHFTKFSCNKSIKLCVLIDLTDDYHNSI